MELREDYEPRLCDLSSFLEAAEGGAGVAAGFEGDVADKTVDVGF